MTNKEIKKIQAFEAHLWLELHTQAYRIAVMNEGVNYEDFQKILDENIGYRRKVSAWCSVRDLREAMGIDRDLHHPDADKAFEMSQRVWELTSH